MERSLLWIVLALGWAGWLCGLVLARARLMGAAKRLSAIPRPYLITALVLPFLVFAATLPSRPPLFETGHGLGNGFLLGGLGALLAALIPLLSEREAGESANSLRSAAAVAGVHALPLALTAMPLLLMRDNLLDALSGIAIGWFCVSTTLYAGLLRRPQNTVEKPAPLLPLSLLSGAAFVALLCAVAALGEIRAKVITDSVPDGVSLSTIGLAFAAGVPLFLLLTALPNRIFHQMAAARSDAARLAGNPVVTPMPLSALLWRTLFSVAALAVLGRMLSRHLMEKELSKGGGALNLFWLMVGPSRLFHVMAVGLLAGLLIWWLMASRTRQEQDLGDAPPLWQNGALAVLTLLAGFMVAYQIEKGLGVGLMLIGAWISVGLALTFGLERAESPSEAMDSSALTTGANLLRLAFLGVILLLYRLLSSRFEIDATGIALTDHYAIFGLLVGSMLPLMLSGFLLRPVTESPALNLLRLIAAGAILLGVPALVIVLWGAKCILALLIGLALALAFEAVRGTGSTETGKESASPIPGFLPALFALGTGLALSQWTGHVLEIWQLTRAEKIHALVYIVVALAVLMLLADYSGRFRTRRQDPMTPDGAKGAAS